ncbi:hypothetical protein TWF481_005233 [Arthrobotrys musiformis]|uniref:Uncharacterized protein n=1 Tax=Arthrobotrys musiformis TaxID=47236 RepID=A0AAV9WIT8_9PEZI
MWSKHILPILVPCVAIVAAQETIASLEGNEAKLEARFTITLTTAFEDYPDKLTGLLTDPNAYHLTDPHSDVHKAKPTPTTLETVVRPADTNANPTPTGVAMAISQDPEPITTPGYQEALDMGLEYSTMGQHILLYGAHSEGDIDHLDSLLKQAKEIYGDGQDLRCYAPYRTSKYLPGADVTGYLESRILVCENGFSLRLSSHQLGTSKAEFCRYVGIEYSEKFQMGIRNGTGKLITPHNVEDEKYKLIASAYTRRANWDVRFGFEKKGCPNREGTEEERAEYVKVYTPEEWKEFANNNPGVMRGIADFAMPSPPIASLGELPPEQMPATSTQAVGAGETANVMRRDGTQSSSKTSDVPASRTPDVPTSQTLDTSASKTLDATASTQTLGVPSAQDSESLASGISDVVEARKAVINNQAAALFLAALGLGIKSGVPTPTPTDSPVEITDDHPADPTPADPTAFDPADPMFSDPPAHTLTFIRP